MAISSGSKANLSSSNTYSANALTLGGTAGAAGTWGSSSSSPQATYQNDNFFSNVGTTGLVTVATGSSFIYYTRQSGDWHLGTTWSTVGFGNATNLGGTYPKSGNVVNIGGGAVNSVTTVTVTKDEFCSTLTYESANANNNTVTISSGKV